MSSLKGSIILAIQTGDLSGSDLAEIANAADAKAYQDWRGVLAGPMDGSGGYVVGGGKPIGVKQWKFVSIPVPSATLHTSTNYQEFYNKMFDDAAKAFGIPPHLAGANPLGATTGAAPAESNDDPQPHIVGG